VQPKLLPAQYTQSEAMPLLCLIGVNYKHLVVTKMANCTLPMAVLPIEQVECSLSLYSLFVTHQTMNFRFDGKMLFHFGELLKKYQKIRRKFAEIFHH
jgi:hypothetical protein